MCRPMSSRWPASICATRCWRWRSIWCGASPASCRLGHAAFFALGGYAMGMYLMRQIGTRGVYGNPILPDFMVFLGWDHLPWYWYGFDWFGFRRADGGAGARRAGTGVRLAGVPLARHRRVSVDHHPGADLRAAAGVLPQRHGLRRQQRPDRLQGHPGLHRAGRDHALRPAGAVRAVPLRPVPARALRCDVALRQGADRGARHRIAHAVPRLPPGDTTSCSCSCCRR